MTALIWVILLVVTVTVCVWVRWWRAVHWHVAKSPSYTLNTVPLEQDETRTE